MDFTLERMTDQDWEAVKSIYQEGIAGGNSTFETEASVWELWDANHLPVSRLVARVAGRVVGWTALSPVSRRRVYSGVAEVSLYVAAAARGQGVGKSLLSALIAESERAGIWTLQGGIFPENVASLRLTKSCGFREVGYRERIGQMDGVWRNVILVERRRAVV
ncbi:MAG: N-acetyltransferase [Acidobacteria bacterium]|nr:N-acetyltransferase [Acidobacteriota bacterium]MBI3657499.1 N-acetyltransferase [Acidobacteriota bacterium]